jgi:hypothetical protein
MSTAPPTTSPPTTLAPTTLAPTTPAPLELTVDPIEITVSTHGVRSAYPPAAVNSALDQSFRFNPIEITISVEGHIQNKVIVVDPIEITVTQHHSSMEIGTLITVDAIDIVISIPTSVEMLLDFEDCNWVWWSKVGDLDFTIDESNLAGKRPLDWYGCVYHTEKIGSIVGVYGANGVSIMKPSGISWGMDTIHRIGLKNKGAFVGNDKYHFFVDLLGQLFQFDNKLTKLDYSEFLSQMGTIILSLDEEKELVYITDETYGYVYSINDQSLGEAPANITGIGVKSNTLNVVSSGAIVTPRFEIATDIYDLGSRKPKTIQRVELGTNIGQFLRVSVDYRKDYMSDFKQIGWFVANHDGRAYPKCYGVEFRFRVRSVIYEYFELDYIKVRGHIHGYSYLDTT